MSLSLVLGLGNPLVELCHLLVSDLVESIDLLSDSFQVLGIGSGGLLLLEVGPLHQGQKGVLGELLLLEGCLQVYTIGGLPKVVVESREKPEVAAGKYLTMAERHAERTSEISLDHSFYIF